VDNNETDTLWEQNEGILEDEMQVLCKEVKILSPKISLLLRRREIMNPETPRGLTEREK
jgi:hypothetical protein